MSKISHIFFLTLAVCLGYFTSLRYGFSQDDWFHLSISQASSIKEFLNFFNPLQVNWIFFRPLSTQLPYFLALLFPLHIAPYFMHSLMLIIHGFNAYLVYKIALRYLSPRSSLLLGSFYAFSSIHFLSLFYIGAIQQLISTCFSLLAINYLSSSKRPSPIYLAIFTILALLSKEIAIRLPLILLGLSYLTTHNLVKSLKVVGMSFLVMIIYLTIRLVLGSNYVSDYSLVVSVGPTLATMLWYVLFSAGFPEYLLHYGLSRGRINFLQFVQDFGLPAWLIVLSAVIILTLFIVRTISHFKTQTLRSHLIYPLLALISLGPVIFLPTHRYPHYLDLFILLVGIYLLKSIKQLSKLGMLLLACVMLGNLSSIWIESQTHWTIKRALLSSELIKTMSRTQACQNPEGVIFSGDKLSLQEISYAMSIENGPRIICRDPDLKVYYNLIP